MKWLAATLEEIPESLRDSAVKQADGTYIIESDGLVKKNSELIADNKKYKELADKFKELEGKDPKELLKAVTEMANLETQRKALDGAIQTAVAEASKEWTKKLEGANATSGKYKSALESVLIDKALAEQIVAAKGNPLFISHHLRGNLQTVEENGEFVVKVIDPKTRTARVDAQGNPMTIKGLVEEAKTNDMFKGAFEAPAASGSGTPPNGTPTQGAGSVVRLTAEQAKDARTYREALGKVNGDANKIQIVS